MIKDLTPWRFKKLEPGVNPPLTDFATCENWLKGWLMMKTAEGNIKVEIEYRHRSWWKKEFDLTDEFINENTI